MRVLVLSAFLACACAAPSAPVLALAPIIPAAIPTLSPGDLQAAAIDAKVQAEDQARALAEQARLATEQARLAAEIASQQAELALENQKEKVEEVNSVVKEKSEDLVWNVEDKKWQAVDAVKTLEAKLDGLVASNADALAKSAIPIYSPIGPILTPNLVYAPGLIPLGLKDEKLVKIADPVKSAESGDLKDKPEGPKLEGLPLAPNLEGLALAPQPTLGLLGAPWVQAPIALYQPGLLAAPLPLQPVLTQVIKQS